MRCLRKCDENGFVAPDVFKIGNQKLRLMLLNCLSTNLMKLRRLKDHGQPKNLYAAFSQSHRLMQIAKEFEASVSLAFPKSYFTVLEEVKATILEKQSNFDRKMWYKISQLSDNWPQLEHEY